MDYEGPLGRTYIVKIVISLHVIRCIKLLHSFVFCSFPQFRYCTGLALVRSNSMPAAPLEVEYQCP